MSDKWTHHNLTANWQAQFSAYQSAQHHLEKGLFMKCDPEDYRAELAAFDLTKEKEDELLLTLWEMMRICVEIGFGTDVIHNVFNERAENTDQK